VLDDILIHFDVERARAALSVLSDLLAERGISGRIAARRTRSHSRRRSGGCSCMSVELLIANLLRVAQEDLDGARTLARARNRNAIYLCEQAAEKVIRAVVSSEGLHAGVRHRLDEMVDLVPGDNPLKPSLRAIEYLAAYATTYRYPTAAGRIKGSPDEQKVTRPSRRWRGHWWRRRPPSVSISLAGTLQPVRQGRYADALRFSPGECVPCVQGPAATAPRVVAGNKRSEARTAGARRRPW
jgi:HEPN domain-containing protein